MLATLVRINQPPVSVPQEEVVFFYRSPERTKNKQTKKIISGLEPLKTFMHRTRLACALLIYARNIMHRPVCYVIPLKY